MKIERRQAAIIYNVAEDNMKTTITAKNFTITEGINSAIWDKTQKFSKYLGEDKELRVTMEAKKNSHKIVMMTQIKGTFIKVEAVDKDLYYAIDTVCEKFKRQLEKHFDRHNRDKKNRENEDFGKSIRFPKEIQEESFIIPEDYQHPVDLSIPIITKRKVIDLKPMSESEAILQMEYLGHQSFMFHNSDEDAVCMIYKRKDGNYGLIM